jgi:nucleotide-binding universal stress UspA family protein
MVPEIRKILFTSDLSETSKHAFTYALSLAGRYKAEVVFLYVMHEIESSVKPFISPELLESFRRDAAKEARATLTGKRRDMAMIRSGLKEFVDVTMKDLENSGEPLEAGEVIVAEGNVVDVIIDTAKERNCDAIVLGSRHRSALAEAMFGSVVRGVLRNADRLVIVAPPLSKTRRP